LTLGIIPANLTPECVHLNSSGGGGSIVANKFPEFAPPSSTITSPRGKGLRMTT
jgi:hypothetical protein